MLILRRILDFIYGLEGFRRDYTHGKINPSQRYGNICPTPEIYRNLGKFWNFTACEKKVVR